MFGRRWAGNGHICEGIVNASKAFEDRRIFCGYRIRLQNESRHDTRGEVHTDVAKTEW